MHLLLCAATEFEIKPLTDYIRDEKVQGVSILITGIGLTATTYALTKSVIHERPRFIIQAGIAGCLDLSLPLTKIVLVRDEFLGDLGVHEKGSFHSVFDMNLSDKNAFPYNNGKLRNESPLLEGSALTTVTGVTVNEISTSPERISYYRSLGAQVESMEGAALHYVAMREKIPFLQIRSLSNFAGERDKGKWMMAPAIGSLNYELHRILLKLIQSWN